MVKKSIVMLSCLLMLLAIACKKEPHPDLLQADASILWEGDPEEGGCGWIFLIDGWLHRPIAGVHIAHKYRNPRKFQVTIEYSMVSEWQEYECGSGELLDPWNFVHWIHLRKIKERW